MSAPSRAPHSPQIRAVVPWLLALVIWGFMIKLCFFVNFASDTHAYWLTGHVEDLYRNAPATKDAYLYSPAFAQIVAPLTALSFPAFYGLWVFVEAIILAWLVWPLRTPWALCVFALCIPELIIGNIYLLMAGAIALSVKRPEFWSFLILTKVTPGIGLLYFAILRDWQKLARAVFATLAIVVVSFVVAPGLWGEWISFMIDNGGGKPWLYFQLAAAAAVVVVAGRSGRPWLIPVAVLISFPVLNTPAAPAVLAAIPRLRAQTRVSPDVDTVSAIASPAQR
ncbi:glycosyltransferase family 87 protein [Nocardioides alpinus]|uniref:glycosyltransferase family 87 protein n=1 Tax=Nocardioides alpinus TaxID=748909 RepID=UPI0012FF3895|nr:glycosyltransferase family 87 protein [Nocardioides alpinus]